MADFRAYWLLLDYNEQQLEYHLGCAFVPNDGDLIVVDEIDALMFKDPIKFKDSISNCLVIGFTATPGNANPISAESRVVSLLKFQTYHYILDQQAQK